MGGKAQYVTPTPEWQDCIASIIENPGLAIVIGASDSGKTTFCLELLNATISAGGKPALVDADIGQSEVGPPGAIGLGEASEPVEKLSDIHVRRMYFVGATSPVGNMLQVVAGSRKMVDEARSHGAETIIVDTSGLVQGALGRKLKTYKIDLLSPRHIVAIQRGREIDPLIASFSKIEKFTTHVLPASPLVKSKSPDLRAARRRLRIARRFQNAEGHVIRFDDVVCWGAWLNNGTALPWQKARLLERILKVRVLHAEATGRGYYVVVEKLPLSGAIQELQEELKTREITVVPGSAFTYTYVGLADARANVLDVGLIQVVDFGQRHMSVITPLKSITPVRVVQFGSMRVKPDGTELAKLRPGEI